MWLRCTLLFGVLLIGCTKSETNSPPAPSAEKSVPAWEKRAAELTALIKPGMSEEEVIRVAGDPKRTKAMVTSGISLVTWEYELGEKNFFKVRFDKNNRVASARFESSFELK